jgi:hypothetical protein
VKRLWKGIIFIVCYDRYQRGNPEARVLTPVGVKVSYARGEGWDWERGRFVPAKETAKNMLYR